MLINYSCYDYALQVTITENNHFQHARQNYVQSVAFKSYISGIGTAAE